MNILFYASEIGIFKIKVFDLFSFPCSFPYFEKKISESIKNQCNFGKQLKLFKTNLVLLC